jgi:hypothetical protein
MKNKHATLTKEQFAYFSSRLLFWQKILGVIDLEVIPMFKTYKTRDLHAEFEKHTSCGTLWVTLNKAPRKDQSAYDLDKSAFHEIFEGGYLSELRHMAKSTYSNYEVETQTHRVVRMAENTIFELLRGDATAFHPSPDDIISWEQTHGQV